MDTADSDFPGEGLAGPGSGQSPLPRSPGGRAPAANRPIPLKPLSANSVPETVDDDDEEKDDLYEALRNAPSWLASTLFHMTLLIVLGLIAVKQHFTPEKMEVVAGSGMTEAEQLGDQLEDPSILSGVTQQIGEGAILHNEPVMTPSDLVPLGDLPAPPDMVGLIKMPASPVTGNTTGLPTGSGITLGLSGRRGASRGALLGRFGGNSATEAAVERGLAWLAKQQKADGTWSLTGPYTEGTLSENSAAATAMALLAFLGHGDTNTEGRYAKNVARGASALVKMQRGDGCIVGAMSEVHQLLYCHAQCTIALCELYGMTKDGIYKGPAERAIAFAVASQDKIKGGWRYVPGEDSDTSVTGWFVMALQSARMAGMKVPAETLKKVVFYLDSAALDDGRRYGYSQTINASQAMNAEGLLCRQYLGWKQDDPRLVEGVTALINFPVRYDGSINQDVYYWYYATQAAHHMEGQIWEAWNQVMRKEVPEQQVKEGPETGSWNPGRDKWGNAGGRLYVTCLSIYMLEVYYRHLPIYSGYKFVPPPDEPETVEAPGDVKLPDPQGQQAGDAKAKQKAAAAKPAQNEKSAE